MDQLVKPITWLLGIVLTVVGVLGFFMDPILGIFEVDMLHNIIHLASGVVGLIAASQGFAAARGYLVVFGLIYGLVTVIGFVQQTTVLGLMAVNSADNYLHLGIAAVSLLVGLLGGKKAGMAMA